MQCKCMTMPNVASCGPQQALNEMPLASMLAGLPSIVCVESICLQKDLYKYITESPSYEQAERNVKQLAIDFQKELGEAQKAIEERF